MSRKEQIMSSILPPFPGRPDARQVTHDREGRVIVLPAHVFKFDIGPDGFELTEEEERWLLLGEEYQFPSRTVNSSLLFQTESAKIIHVYGEYKDLHYRFEELRARRGTRCLMLTKDGYEERYYDGKSRYTLIYDTNQNRLMIEQHGANGHMFVEERFWCPPPRRMPGYRSTKVLDLALVRTIIIHE
jgi:hypothetical protein